MGRSIQTIAVEGGKEAEKEIKGVQNALDKFGKTAQKNRDATRLLDKATGGAVTKFNDLQKGLIQGTKGLKGLALGFKGLSKAIIATGIGAIVVALGAIYAYWDDITEAINGVSAETKTLLGLQEEQVAATQEAYDTIAASENILRQQGQTEQDILNLKKLATDEAIAALEAQLITQKEIKKAQVETAERNSKILSGIILMLTAPLAAVLVAVDEVAKVLGKEANLAKNFYEGIGTFVFDPEGIAEEGEEAINETENQLTKLKNRKAGFELQEQKNKKAASDKAKADQEKADKKAIDDEKKKQEALEKIRQGGIDTEEERRAEERKKINDEYTQLLLDQEKFGGDREALLEAQETKLRELREKFALEDKAKADADKLLEQEKIIEQLELDAEFEQLTFDEQRQLLNERQQQLLQDETLSEEQRTKLSAAFGKARVKIVELEQKQKEEATMSYANSLSKISGLLGAETQAGKLTASAAALIATYLNANKARESQLAIPTPDAPFRAALAMAAEIASGLANVKAINSVKVPKASGGGSPSAPRTPATVSAPSFNIVGGSDTSQLAETIASQTQEPVRAFVVSNDVTTAQSLERNIVEGATI